MVAGAADKAITFTVTLAGAVVSTIIAVAGMVAGAADKAITFTVTLAGALASAVISLTNAIINVADKTVTLTVNLAAAGADAVKNFVNHVIDLLNEQIAKVKIFGDTLIPHVLAEGGIVTSPTLAILGEKGPEAVVPLGPGSASGLQRSLTSSASFGRPILIQLTLDGRVISQVEGFIAENEEQVRSS